MRAVQIEEVGGPEMMKLASLPLPQLAPGQALIKVSCATVNYVDTYFRRGIYPGDLPMILGSDGVGVIEAFGPDSEDENAAGLRAKFALGDRVAFFSRGAYAEFVACPLWKMVKVPDEIADAPAAASMINGMTAHYLARDCHKVKPDDTVLIHAIAGGTGQWLCQICKKFGAVVIGTCSTAEKAQLAKSLGADHIINYRETPDFAAEVAKIAPDLCEVVYDGVGAATWEGSLKCVKRRGLLCLFGNASGTVPPIDPLALTRQGSVFLTRPSLFGYCTNADETQARADDLFAWMGEGMVVNICREFSMRIEDVRAAHELIESRGTTGKILICPCGKDDTSECEVCGEAKDE